MTDSSPRPIRSGIGAMGGLRLHRVVPHAVFLMEQTDRVDGRRQGLALRNGQVRIPDIEDQYDASFRARVPCFMDEGVVEDEALAFLPSPWFARDAQCAAIWRHDQRQMYGQAAVDDARMRWDVGPGAQHGEHCLRTVLRDVVQG